MAARGGTHQPIVSPHTALRAHDVRGRSIAVSSGHPFASAEAVRVFHNGGNVIDAAIAGAAVLAVVLPYACGIGGDAYLLFHDSRTKTVHGLNGTGAAPAGATLSRLAEGIPQVGVHAATVPGAVAAWDDALSRFGTLSLREVMQSAIRYAYEGFPIHQGLIENVEEKHALLLRDPEARRLFLPQGGTFSSAQIMIQSDLGRSLERIAANGAREFYEGILAQEIVQKTQAMGGLFSIDDFSRHQSLWQDALHVPFYGYDVLTMPPNSVGIILLLELAALQASDVHLMDPDTLSYWRQTISAWRWARTVSADAIGDPQEAVERATDLLLRVRAARSSFGSVELPPTVPSMSGDTSNLVIMDSDGNAVSLVQSISAPFASGVVVPGTGILLNNRMRGFNTIEGSINCVSPGRRPAHTLVPALVAKNRRIAIAIGTPGATGQPVTLGQVLIRALACRQDIAKAIEAPRWSVAPSGRIMVERTVLPFILDGLAGEEPDLGVEDVRHVRFGSVKVVCREGDSLRAIADYRRVAGACAG